MGWAPYHYGHWAWVDPWGWTWVDDAPWGFAPFHYGRWAYHRPRGAGCRVRSRCGRSMRRHWSHSSAAIGFGVRRSAVAGIAWFPLGSGEVYRPAYAVSRDYFTNINVSNTVVNNTVINNYYNNTNVTNVVYRNREVAGAVTAVPTTAFASGRPIARQPSRSPEARWHAAGRRSPRWRHRARAFSCAGAVGAAAVAVVMPAAGRCWRGMRVARPRRRASPLRSPQSALLAAQPGKPLEAEKITRIRPPKSGAESKWSLRSVTAQPRQGPRR